MENYEQFKLELEANRLLGDYTGFCRGLLWYEIPVNLKKKIEEKIKELEQTTLPTLLK